MDTPQAISIGFNTYVLTGWCFGRIPGKALEVVAVLEDEFCVAYLGLPRPDVVLHYQESGSLNCGYVLRFRCLVDKPRLSLLVRYGRREFMMVQNIQLHLDKQSSVRQAEPVSNHTRICISLSTRNPHPYFLKRCLDSVLEQQYENWQLCVTDYGCNSEVLSMIRNYAGKEKRIHMERTSGWGSIVVFLGENDELPPDALLELAFAANNCANGELFYSDEDIIDEHGIRKQAVVKDDFDEDVFLSRNYLGHMIAIKTHLAEHLDCFEASCNWDRLIRVTERLDSGGIQHIRKALYRRRIPMKFELFGIDDESPLSKSHVIVLQDHIRRTGKQAFVTESVVRGALRLKYLSPKDLEIGVSFRSKDGEFQRGVVQTNGGNRKLYLYDSTDDDSFELENRRGDIFVFVNGPLECLNHHFFEELVAQAMRAECAAVTGISISTGTPGAAVLEEMNTVRSIEVCPYRFFAVRRAVLSEMDRLGIFVSQRIPLLADLLTQYSHDKELSILFTPYAVATFADGEVEDGCAGEQLISAKESLSFKGESVSGEAQAVEAENEQLAAALSALRLMESSLSWRITRPLREIMRMLRGGWQ